MVDDANSTCTCCTCPRLLLQTQAAVGSEAAGPQLVFQTCRSLGHDSPQSLSLRKVPRVTRRWLNIDLTLELLGRRPAFHFFLLIYGLVFIRVLFIFVAVRPLFVSLRCEMSFLWHRHNLF